MRNAGIRFVCRTVGLTVANDRSVFTNGYSVGEHIQIPVAHHDGNYFADSDTLDRLEGEGRVAFRYTENVNGSARNIAGVLNATGNVLGMMPHPERMTETVHGGSDGRRLFEGLLRQIA
jgi:phosphoribosylformylglycinamidine synthase